jgi:hypothetical protein
VYRCCVLGSRRSEDSRQDGGEGGAFFTLMSSHPIGCSLLASIVALEKDTQTKDAFSPFYYKGCRVRLFSSNVRASLWAVALVGLCRSCTYAVYALT